MSGQTYEEKILDMIERLEFVSDDAEAIMSTANEGERVKLEKVRQDSERAANHLRQMKATIRPDRLKKEI